MKVTLDFPPEWDKILKDAAHLAGAQSKSEFMRQAVVQRLEQMGIATQSLPSVSKQWGHKKDTEVAHVTKDTSDTKDTKVTKVTKVTKDTSTNEPAKDPVVQPPVNEKPKPSNGMKPATPKDPSKIPQHIGRRTAFSQEEDF